jgi:hypothetical protein
MHFRSEVESSKMVRKPRDCADNLSVFYGRIATTWTYTCNIRLLYSVTCHSEKEADIGDKYEVSFYAVVTRSQSWNKGDIGAALKGIHMAAYKLNLLHTLQLIGIKFSSTKTSIINRNMLIDRCEFGRSVVELCVLHHVLASFVIPILISAAAVAPVDHIQRRSWLSYY